MGKVLGAAPGGRLAPAVGTAQRPAGNGPGTGHRAGGGRLGGCPAGSRRRSANRHQEAKSFSPITLVLTDNGFLISKRAPPPPPPSTLRNYAAYPGHPRPPGRKNAPISVFAGNALVVSDNGRNYAIAETTSADKRQYFTKSPRYQRFLFSNPPTPTGRVEITNKSPRRIYSRPVHSYVLQFGSMGNWTLR